MNNYNCNQCGFLNRTTADQCSRCGLPNSANNQPQFSTPPMMPNTLVSATPQTAVQTQYVQPQNYQTPQYQTPPQFHGQRQQPYSAYNNAPPIEYTARRRSKYNGNDLEIEKAIKQVKTGWIAGLVWALLLAIATVFFAFMPMMVGTRNNPELKGLDNEAVAMVSRIMSGVLMIITFTIGILSFGIRQNSLACAVILTILSGLGIFSSLAEKNLASTLFGVLFFVLFCVSVNGINTLKKHGQV
jgi:hypothetical protein